MSDNDEMMQQLSEVKASWQDGKGLFPGHASIDQQITAAVPIPKSSVEYKQGVIDLPMPAPVDSTIAPPPSGSSSSGGGP